MHRLAGSEDNLQRDKRAGDAAGDGGSTHDQLDRGAGDLAAAVPDSGATTR